MLDNNLYNLLLQITQENKSLWRIKNKYIADAEGDEASLAFWRKMQADKEDHVNELLGLIKDSLERSA
ncbi:hypothetical protein L0Y49_00720 [bacterium]|nr:hypothetical protein [bacterium]MCI0566374.1 hypothetical protein [bacterium]MCI0680100.1 hypothetical protein [bacterium]